MTRDFFRSNPMLWLAFPLMAGITAGWLCGISVLCSALLFVPAMLVMIMGVCTRLNGCFFSVAAFVAMFALGVVVEHLDAARFVKKWSGVKGRFEAVLLETPHVGGRAAMVQAQVARIGRDSVPDARREGLVNLYFANSVDVERLNVGERIFFEGRVASPRNAGNPAEFDTEHFLYVRGITGTAYLPMGVWRSDGVADKTLLMYAMDLRERVLQIYDSLGFEGEEGAVLSALTLGEKRDLSQGVRDLYSAVGASHVLALSGLHLGILYMLITMLLPVRGVSRLPIIMRELLVLLLLWGFAAMAGLTASVVRAVILFTLMSVARCLQREGSVMNALGFAAIVMLVVCPRWLFDVSFQLSFAAVWAILLLEYPLRRLMRVEKHGRAYAYVAGVVAVSLSAQLGTLPFVWYYFGTFPLCFLITNFIVMPAAFCVMLLAVLMLALSPFVLLQQFVAWVLKCMLYAMNLLLRGVADLPGASVELPYIGVLGAFVVAVVLFVLLYGVLQRRKVYVAVSLLLSMLFVAVLVARKFRDEVPYVLFFNSRSCPAAQLVVSSERSYLMSSYPEWDIDLSYVAEPFWRREGMSQPILLHDGFTDEKVSMSGRLVHFEGRRIAMLSDDCWMDETHVQPVDCIFLCRGFLGKIKRLLEIYPTRYIVMDATLYEGSRRRIARECAQAGVRCLNLKDMGAMKLLCRGGGINFVSMKGR
ncbi:MAG: ComEC/Rec2 family competence protein [Bacteroidaceae bacterium]|nr:ComEC/Rec2 family competence protein [Bacteroidaceae bacterium]